MIACWLADLSDEEIVARLVARGARERDARALVEERDEVSVHDAIERMLEAA